MSMPWTLDQMMKEVSASRRKKIERRAAKLIAEEKSLEQHRAKSFTKKRSGTLENRKN